MVKLKEELKWEFQGLKVSASVNSTTKYSQEVKVIIDSDLSFIKSQEWYIQVDDRGDKNPSSYEVMFCKGISGVMLAKVLISNKDMDMDLDQFMDHMTKTDLFGPETYNGWDNEDNLPEEEFNKTVVLYCLIKSCIYEACECWS